MAVPVNGGGYGSRRRGGGHTLSEINVTPFVDVVLVLLIIFMLTAHVMEYGLQIEVPKVKAVERTPEEFPIVSIDKTGAVYLNGKDVNINDLKTAIQAQFGQVKGIYVQADRQTIWDPIAQVTAALGAAGFQVNMVTQPEDSSTRSGKR